MKFEILHRDGLGRVGRLKTAHGTLTTPTLMPVINPMDRPITPEEMRREFGVELVMTNAYLILKHFGEDGVRKGVHKIIDYQGPVMTDSGGYQILRYGTVDVSPEEIIRYQEAIGSDIATILDVPTGATATREKAEETVKITLQRAWESIGLRSKAETLWCGPVQGGLFFDLVEHSAREIGAMDFHLHAIGSPVELMEEYRYLELVGLVMAAKKNLPLERPVHLFGAGHPMMLSLAVLMGCDLFDSAAYILYARDGRYMTAQGTLRLEELKFFPCECPMCSAKEPSEVMKMEEEERLKFIARHNLHVTFGELRRIRQAIVEGRLWEHVQQRCTAHPRLLDGFRELLKHSEFIERFDQVTKPSAFFHLGKESGLRPEVIRHRRRMERYSPPPFSRVVVVMGKEPPEMADGHVIKIVPPFGIVPEELDEVYPLWQTERPELLDEDEIAEALRSLEDYLRTHGEKYEEIVVCCEGKWKERVVEICRGKWRVKEI